MTIKVGDRVNCRGNNPATPGTVVDDEKHLTKIDGLVCVEWDDGYDDYHGNTWHPDELEHHDG